MVASNVKFNDTVKTIPHPELGEFEIRMFFDAAYIPLHQIVKRVLKYNTPSLSTETMKKVTMSNAVFKLKMPDCTMSKIYYTDWQGLTKFGKIQSNNENFKKRQELAIEFADWLREVERQILDGNEEAIFALAKDMKKPIEPSVSEDIAAAKDIIKTVTEESDKGKSEESVKVKEEYNYPPLETTPPAKIIKLGEPKQKDKPIDKSVVKETKSDNKPSEAKSIKELNKDAVDEFGARIYDKGFSGNYQPLPHKSYKNLMDFSVINWELAARDREAMLNVLAAQLESLTKKSVGYWKGFAWDEIRKVTG